MDTRARASVLDWRSQVVEEALTWHGTPFHSKGRIKGVGADCGGIIYEVFKKVLGIPLEPFPTSYAEDWALHHEDEIYLEFLRPYVTRISRPQPGDLTMWKVGRNFSHGTLFIGDRKYIHAFGKTGTGSVIISKARSFTIGAEGRMRECKHFTVSDKWL